MKIREFINKNLGKVRCIVLDEKIYFIGKDVADALGYSNSSKAVSTHCKHTRKEMISHSQNGNAHKAEFLKEINVPLRNNRQLKW